MAIFDSYVSLPEGNPWELGAPYFQCSFPFGPWTEDDHRGMVPSQYTSMTYRTGRVIKFKTTSLQLARSSLPWECIGMSYSTIERLYMVIYTVYINMHCAFICNHRSWRKQTLPRHLASMSRRVSLCDTWWGKSPGSIGKTQTNRMTFTS
jgi:hypothetical protein